MSNHKIDPTRAAAAVLLEELARLASQAAERLRGPADLPPLVVGQLLVTTNRVLTRIGREVDRLQAPGPSAK